MSPRHAVPRRPAFAPRSTPLCLPPAARAAPAAGGLPMAAHDSPERAATVARADAEGEDSTGAPGDAAPPAAPLVISTDRPSFSDGTGIQPVGRLNVRTGFTWTIQDDDGVDTRRTNGPEVLLRTGPIEDRLEVRVMTSGYAWARTRAGGAEDTATGWTDPSVGIKWKALDQDGWTPRIVIGARSTLGGGNRNVASGRMEPVVKGPWSRDLGACAGEAWSGTALGGSGNVAFPTTDGDRVTQGQGSLWSAFPVADRVTAFAEWFTVVPVADHAGAAHGADIGITWILSDRVQVDLRVGRGLNGAADDAFVGAGIAFLFWPEPRGGSGGGAAAPRGAQRASFTAITTAPARTPTATTITPRSIRIVCAMLHLHGQA